jgi:sugar lactone lactonase YvrE
MALASTVVACADESLAPSLTATISSATTTPTATTPTDIDEVFTAVTTRSSEALQSVSGLAVAADGRVYASDFQRNAVYELAADGSWTLLAGGESAGFADGQGKDALFYGPSALTVSPDGSIVVADSLNHRIRAIEPDGTVRTLAGTGPSGLGAGGFEDGPALEARFNLPSAVAFDADGNLLIVDKENHAVRVLGPNGIVSTLVGGREGYADGEITTSLLSFPVGLAISPTGTIYLTEHGNNAVRRIDGPTVSTVARRVPFQLPDPPDAGTLAFPSGLAVGVGGAILVADVQNNRIVTVTDDGRIVPVAGSQSAGLRDGPPRDALFSSPTTLLVLPGGNVLIADSGNGLVREMAK